MIILQILSIFNNQLTTAVVWLEAVIVELDKVDETLEVGLWCLRGRDEVTL